MTGRVFTALMVCCFAVAACRDTTEGIRTQFVGSHAFSGTERRAISRVAGDAFRDARRHLPALPPQIVLQVTSGTDVIPELGATATVAGLNFVQWTVDPGNPQGVVTIAERHLRGALFHEFHHLVRIATTSQESLMDRVVLEGMATAFERDFAGVSPLWSQYPNDVSTWVDVLLALPPTTSPDEWMTAPRPDGRRWVGMRAGTYLVDRAMKTLNRTAAELVSTPTAEILAAAGLKQ
jgi:hypothetical protein